MSDHTKYKQDFGCQACWPKSAEEACQSLAALSPYNRLVDESHFIITLGACPNCAQQFVKVFTETIDWVGGEDPQYRTCMPLTQLESDQLSQFKDVTDHVGLIKTLEQLSPQRPSLKMDWPKGKPQTKYWGAGIQIGHYD